MKTICGVRYSRKAPNLSSSENKRTEVEGHSALSEESRRIDTFIPA